MCKANRKQRAPSFGGTQAWLVFVSVFSPRSATPCRNGASEGASLAFIHAMRFRQCLPGCCQLSSVGRNTEEMFRSMRGLVSAILRPPLLPLWRKRKNFFCFLPMALHRVLWPFFNIIPNQLLLQQFLSWYRKALPLMVFLCPPFIASGMQPFHLLRLVSGFIAHKRQGSCAPNKGLKNSRLLR